MSLLSRLYDATEGQITIDDILLADYDVAALRKVRIMPCFKSALREAKHFKSIGIVQQEPYLFNGTVSENISLGREGVDDVRIRQAADIANVTEFVNRLQDVPFRYLYNNFFKIKV